LGERKHSPFQLEDENRIVSRQTVSSWLRVIRNSKERLQGILVLTPFAHEKENVFCPNAKRVSACKMLSLLSEDTRVTAQTDWALAVHAEQRNMRQAKRN
jgi:hypothetical protein